MKSAPRAGTSVRAPLTACSTEQLVIADGTLETIKWLGLVLMTADHINKFLCDGRLPAVYEAGRIVMPLFAFVLGYNLARPNAVASGAVKRTAARLAGYGALATPPFVLLVGWWPLNVLFTLLIAVVIVWLLEGRISMSKLAAAAALFIAGGAIVEFWWFGILACLSAWGYCRRPTPARALLWIVSSGSLGVVNGNLWSMAAVPLAWGATYVDLRMPRRPSFFYLYYAGHLVALAALVWALSLGTPRDASGKIGVTRSSDSLPPGAVAVGA